MNRISWLGLLLGISLVSTTNGATALAEIPAACHSSTALYVSNRCYWIVTQRNTFTNAHSLCETEGGILADIPDSTVENAVLSLVSTDTWIGINDRNIEGQFRNMLNQAVRLTLWASGEPNNRDSGTAGDCVRIISGRFRDSDCSRTLQAICSQEIQEVTSTEVTTSTPSSTSHSTQPITNPATTESMTTQPTIQLTTQPTIQLTTQPTIQLTTQPDAQVTTQSPAVTITPMVSTDTPTQSPTNNTGCLCPCERTNNLVIIENEAELKVKIETMKRELRVDKAVLSSSVRKRISARDSRPSAVVIGNTLGVSVLVMVFGLMFLSDVYRMYECVKFKLCKQS